MKRIIYFIMLVLLLLNLRIFSQESEDEIYSLSQSISFGWSNPISLTRSILDPVQQEKIGFLIDYQLYNNDKNFYRAHVKFSPSYSKPTFTLNNFLISFHKGKQIIQKDNFKFGHGLGPYFKCNIYRNQQSSGTQVFWSSDYFGFGAEYFIFLDYKIKENLYFNFLLNINFGLHQYYDATIVNGINSQEYWGIKTANQQLISLSLKKQL
ncbi:MAG: hypothetical protein ACJ0QN_05090 [Parvicellaceae bacterium]|tara:strand:+ start:2101 stop:2727 length:627 start_codon:yes stop_codon:yes gene_type:complete